MKDTLSALLTASEQKGLACLLIGGNAVILLGFPRMTIDVDLLVPEKKRSQWLDLMRELGFHLLHGSEAFAQFNPGSAEMAPVDLMFVDALTWANLKTEARQETIAGHTVHLPRVEHLIALKLHAAASPTRSAPEQDWEDIRQMMRAWHPDPADAYFRELILRYGGQEALNRIQNYRNEF
jgi:hypothetical protein